MKRALLPRLLILCILLAGCQSGRPVAVRRGATAFRPDPVVTGTFWVDLGADEILFQAAIDFCARVGRISGGSLVLNVVQEPLEAATPADGGYSLFYADNKQLKNMTGLVGIFDRPFLFKGYDHFTMEANSPQMLETMGFSISARPLAAIYGGQDALASSVSLSDPLSFDGLNVASGQDADIMAAYAMLGAQVTEVPDSSLRLVLLENGEVDAATVNLLELGSYYLPRDYILTLTFQRAKVQWLMADSEWMDTLSATQQGAVMEAAAYALRQADDGILAREEGIMRLMDRRGVLIQSDFDEVRSQIQDAMEPEEGTLQERDLLRLIDEIG